MWKAPRLLLSGTAFVALLLTVLTCMGPEGSESPAAPSFGTAAAPVPVLVGAGDIADCDKDPGESLTAKVIQSMPDATVFVVGDIAYENSTAADYANCYHPSWGQFKNRSRPVLGNHEYQVSATPSFDYFGDAAWGNSRPNGYYSFDLGNWHIIVLNDNSAFVSTSALSPQVKWLQADLAATGKPCVLALWHQPLFYSNPTGSSGPGLLAYRKHLWNPLYQAGADVVINGHRHVYERYGLQDPNGTPTPLGIRQFIVGTGGSSTHAKPTVLSPNSQVQHGGSNQFGVLKLTLYDGSYSWEYIPVGNNTFTDRGSTACHGVTPPAGAEAVVVNDGNNQAAQVGSSVRLPPSVKVTDASGNPIAGVSVRFNVTAGGGQITEDLQTTDATGVARIGSWILGTAVGMNRLEAVVFGLQAAVLTATATVGPANAATSTATVPPGIAGGATTIKVQARDAFGNPLTMGGGTVAASIAGGNTATATVTDVGNGTYTAKYTPRNVGTDQVAISLNGAPLGTSPYPSSIAPKVQTYAGANQIAPAGTILPIRPAVRAVDGFGRALAGVSITFSVYSGGGSITGAVQTTGSTGIATIGSWRLGSLVGSQKLRATVTGTGSYATISATAQ